MDEADAREAPAALRLSEEQRALAEDHLRLVGLHLRTRVPTPAGPRRDREYADLFQEGCMALIRAAARYRPERDGVFAAYALQRIRSAVHVALREYFHTIRVPARVQRTGAWPQDPARLVQDRLPAELPARTGAGGP